MLRTPIVESDRLPKEDAGPGLTSTLLLPRNLEEEETQHEETAKMFRESHGSEQADDQ